MDRSGRVPVLRDLLQGLDVTEIRGSLDLPVRGIAYHSNAVEPGFLFVAVPGSRHDGHAFVADAQRRGASAAVVERIDATLPPEFAQIRVRHGRTALALLGAAWYGHPAREMALVGITGTNGKTTTAHILEAILAQAGKRVGVMGTIEYRYGERRMAAPNTTPESLELQRIFREMADGGTDHVVMEVTSHALAQSRVEGCVFQGAVFTNLTRDHLDYHATMEEYLAAKVRLFEEHLAPAEQGGWAVLNRQDPASCQIRERCRGRVIWYGEDPRAEFRVSRWSLGLNGSEMSVECPVGTVEIRTSLLGHFNVLNALAACAAAWALGVEPAHWVSGVGRLRRVAGRLDPVRDTAETGKGKVTVLVDYAHTPDALDRALTAARSLAQGKLICVFGCGGDRDRGKRPLMAQAAARHCDLVVITSDNPRGESPSAIIQEVVAGLRDTPLGEVSLAEGAVRGFLPGYAVNEDRREAIGQAIRWAAPGDLVVIAGKGHETVQIVGGRTIPFDDREVARHALEERGE
jgi:UDP-N-acetylmuramoyl-L-alanyl-D-glutamate--2,6-diaminopimelate ligase